MRSCVHFPLSVLNSIWLRPVWTLCKLPQSLWVLIHIISLMFWRPYFLGVFHLLWILLSFFLLFCWVYIMAVQVCTSAGSGRVLLLHCILANMSYYLLCWCCPFWMVKMLCTTVIQECFFFWALRHFLNYLTFQEG